MVSVAWGIDGSGFLKDTTASTRIGIGKTPTVPLDVVGDSILGGNTTIGAGAAGVDYTLIFDGETNDGVLTWKEDEDLFEFGDKVNVLGQLGVGLARDAGTLHVKTSSAGVVTPTTDADDVFIEVGTDGGATIHTPDANFSNFYFGSPSDFVGAALSWKFDDLAFNVGTGVASAVLNLKSGNGVTAVSIDGNGKTTLNVAADTNGDVQINTGTTGITALFKASNGFVSIGHGVPSVILDVEDTTASLFTRTTTSSVTFLAGISILVQSSVNVADGFGSGISFRLEDDTSGSVGIGFIGAVRDGADNSGKLQFHSGTNGATLAMSIDAAGEVDIVEHMTPTTFLGSASNLMDRTTTAVTSALTVLDLKATSSNNVTGDLGPGLRFQFEDDTSGTKNIGFIAAQRDGSDTEGKLSFLTGTNGVETMLTIVSNGDVAIVVGNLDISATGKGLGIKEGDATDSVGSATLVAGTVIVSNTNIATGDIIMLSRFTIGGTAGFLNYTIINGTSFTITSASGSDTSVVNYFIIRTL